MPIFKRVSVREFTNQKVDKKDIELILRAGMQSPSAVNQQPWEFLVCDDVDVIRDFSNQGGFARSLKTAPLVIVLYYRINTSHQNFVMQDMGACAENCLLQVANLNLGACWMGVAPKEDRMQEVEKVFGTIDNARPFCLIAVGHPKNQQAQISRYDESRVHYYKK